MKARELFVFPVALLVASLSTVVCQAAFSATYGRILLSGSGPVFSDPMKPGGRSVTLIVDNLNNLNVGYDLIDQGNNTVIANGTIKDKGNVTKTATALARHTYVLRLRCQEPPWNNTSCRAVGRLEW